jgi:hypothetical protein
VAAVLHRQPRFLRRQAFALLEQFDRVLVR